MKRHHLFSALRMWLVAFVCLYSPHLIAKSYDISGPYTTHNLSMFLIHGADRIKNQHFLTLDEAMQKSLVKVYETANVNRLSIENRSKNQYIYIQAGDIVKGGKQDRAFSNDMILEPGSGKVAIGAFCVEHGRWSQRRGESANVFHSSTKKLASKELRLAARLKQSQSAVWNEVSKVQDKLGKNVGHDVKAPTSASSLQLTLENQQLEQRISEYKKALLPLLVRQQHVIGYAFAINGQLNTADIFANQALTKKLWPKIVDAAAAESFANLDKSVHFDTPDSNKVQAWLQQADQGRKSIQQIKPGLTQEKTESDHDVRFETYSGKGDAKKLYRQNYIKK